MAMMSWTGPYEAEAPAWFYVNPPDPSWDDDVKDRWRSLFSATTLPAITAHEVTPGHFAHGRMIRLTARGDVRRSLTSLAFVEGWAHYAEELLVEEGFRQDDPRFAIGVWIEALVRVTRLASALGIHRGTMTVEEATARFREDAYLGGAGRPVRGEPGRLSTRPTAATPGASSRSGPCGTKPSPAGAHVSGLATVPRGPARARRSPARNPRRRARTALTTLSESRRAAGPARPTSGGSPAGPPSPPMLRISTRRMRCLTLSRR